MISDSTYLPNCLCKHNLGYVACVCMEVICNICKLASNKPVYPSESHVIKHILQCQTMMICKHIVLIVVAMVLCHSVSLEDVYLMLRKRYVRSEMLGIAF